MGKTSGGRGERDQEDKFFENFCSYTGDISDKQKTEITQSEQERENRLEKKNGQSSRT